MTEPTVVSESFTSVIFFIVKLPSISFSVIARRRAFDPTVFASVRMFLSESVCLVVSTTSDFTSIRFFSDVSLTMDASLWAFFFNVARSHSIVLRNDCIISTHEESPSAHETEI